jgi:hypothetical protein
MLATGSGFHPIRIRRTPDPVGHKKTGWGKADDSADGAPPVNPTAPRGLRPRTPTAVCKRPSAVCFLCGVDGHPIRALMEAPPAVGRKNFRPSPLFRPGYAQSLALLSIRRSGAPLANIGTLRAPWPCQYWHPPLPGLPILAPRAPWPPNAMRPPPHAGRRIYGRNNVLLSDITPTPYVVK